MVAVVRQQPYHPEPFEILVEEVGLMVLQQKGKNKQMKSLLKPYEKRLFSKINYSPMKYSPLFPKMDTDRDGVPDYIDCEPLNPYKQDKEEKEVDIERILDEIIKEENQEQQQQPEQQEQRNVYIYLFNSDLGEWEFIGQYSNDENTKAMIEDLQRTFSDKVHISTERINPKRIGRKDRFKEFKQKFGEYIDERDFGKNISKGMHPRKRIVDAYYKQKRAYEEGPQVTKGLLERERELTWGRKDRYPWQKYSPVTWQQVSVRAPWQVKNE